MLAMRINLEAAVTFEYNRAIEASFRRIYWILTVISTI